MKVITRIWHGRTKMTDAEKYHKYIEETGMNDYKKLKGNLSAKLLKQIDGDICHFLTVTEWDSYESIMSFAGKNFTKAKYYPEDDKFLLEKEELVNHYETHIYA